MNQKELEKIFQTVQKNVRCPSCGKRYDFDRIHVVSSTDAVCFLQLECENHMPMMVTVAVNKDQPKIEIGEKISVDDVIDVYSRISEASSLKDILGTY